MSKNGSIHLQENSKEVWRQNYKAPKEKTLLDTWTRQALAASSVENESIREEIYKDFLWLLEDFNGMAGGRITANLGVEGREGTTLMNCFSKNANVLTKDGYKKIIDVKIGDFVLTHKGNWKKVVNCLKRKYIA